MNISGKFLISLFSLHETNPLCRTELSEARAEYRQLELERTRDQQKLLEFLQPQPGPEVTHETIESLARDKEELQNINERLPIIIFQLKGSIKTMLAIAFGGFFFAQVREI